MAIFKTPYETTVGSGANLDRFIHPLQEYFINNAAVSSTPSENQQGVELFYLSASTKDADAIPAFAHPVVFGVGRNNQKQYLVADVRPIVSRMALPQPALAPAGNRIRNSGEFLFMSTRAVMSKMWIEGQYSLLRDISFVPCAIYSNWISEAVANRFGLDPKDRLRIQIIAALYYQCLFTDTGLADENDRQKIAFAASKATRAPIEEIFKIIDQIVENLDVNPFANINDFCNAVKTIVENERMQMFNAGILVTVVANTWFGVNSREVTPCALEHPPTWLALVFTSFNEKSFKNSNISMISKRYAANKGENDFVKAFFAMYTANGGFQDMPLYI